MSSSRRSTGGSPRALIRLTFRTRRSCWKSWERSLLSRWVMQNAQACHTGATPMPRHAGASHSSHVMRSKNSNVPFLQSLEARYGPYTVLHSLALSSILPAKVEEISDGGRWDVLSEYTAHDHRERPHQGKGKVVCIAAADPPPSPCWPAALSAAARWAAHIRSPRRGLSAVTPRNALVWSGAETWWLPPFLCST
jgi:hypothetical protein